MGNAKSNTVANHNAHVPLKSVLKKPAVPGSVNGFSNYPASYGPEQYAYAGYPPNYPVVPNENYVQHESYPQPQARKKIEEQQTPQHHSRHSHHHHHHLHQHQQHSSHRRHSHHHHHHPSRTSPENERLNLPDITEHATSARPPSLQTQMPVSFVSPYKSMLPAIHKELVPPPPAVIAKPPSPFLMKNSSAPVLIQHSPSFMVLQRQQTPQPITSKVTPRSPLIPSNNFEKAPPMKINYISKSPDAHSMHNYASDRLTVVQRNSSVHTKPGNRWYDYDHDKRVKPLVVDNL